jgi:prepilin-type N-terminal cleavage/methylation domain-containing protein
MFSGRHAFTLIEILVVMSIIIILIAVSIPTIKALTKGNNEKQAVNLITAMLANARATAISTHKTSGVVVYEYPSANSAPSGFTDTTSYIQLITQSGIDVNSKFRTFIRVPRTDPQRLPKGIQVATLDTGTNQFRTEASTASGGRCRVILFDSTGQMVLYNSLATDSSLSTDAIAQAWNIDGSGITKTASSPGFVIYDANLFNASHQANSANDNTWLRQNADILVVNPYTGTIIR